MVWIWSLSIQTLTGLAVWHRAFVLVQWKTCPQRWGGEQCQSRRQLLLLSILSCGCPGHQCGCRACPCLCLSIGWLDAKLKHITEGDLAPLIHGPILHPSSFLVVSLLIVREGLYFRALNHFSLLEPCFEPSSPRAPPAAVRCSFCRSSCGYWAKFKWASSPAGLWRVVFICCFVVPSVCCLTLFSWTTVFEFFYFYFFRARKQPDIHRRYSQNLPLLFLTQDFDFLLWWFSRFYF